MHRRCLLLSALPLLLLRNAFARDQAPEPRPAWARFFQEADAQGAIVVLDERSTTSLAAPVRCAATSG